MDRPGLVRPVRCDPAGLTGPTRGQARGPGFRRTSRGLFVPRSISDDLPEQRIVEAAVAVPDGAVTGWGALRWLGGSWFGGLDADGSRKPVTLACRHKHRAQPSLQISQEGWMPESDLLVVDDVRVTTAARAVYFEMRCARSLVDAVIVLDMACHADLVTIDEMAHLVGVLGPRTGVAQARLAVTLGDENSWSPQESATRVYWTRGAGLPPLLSNRPVFDRAGRLIGTPDLLDVEAGLVVDYHGAVHLRPGRRLLDRPREEALRDIGLEYLVVVAGDLGTDSLAQRMHRIRARARFEPEESRAWTVEPPAYWVTTHTVESRRALDESARSRLLRYRHAG